MSHHSQRTSPQRRGQIMLMIGIAVALGLASLIAAVVFRNGGGSAAAETEMHIVRRGAFDITLPCSGELVALQQVDIRNQLNTQALITELVEEGTLAKAGDVLVKFNDEELRAQLNEAIDAVNLAETAVVAANSELEVQLNEQESEIAKATLAVYLADLAMQAWTNGEFDSKRRRLMLAIETAQKNFDRLKLRFEASENLRDKEFISMDEFRMDEIAMLESASTLEQAQIDLSLFDNYESKQTEAEKKSNLEQAQGELERTKQRFESRVHSAKSELESKKHQLASKRERKRLLEQQVSYCTITAPSPGLVVYASSMQSGWGWNEQPLRVGSQCYPNQQIILLPDTSRMAAEVKVSEALSGSIKVGQTAVVSSDALPNLTLTGDVVSIGVLAASGGWRDPNRRDYTVRIALSNASDLGLKPAMRCKAEVMVERVTNVLHVPVQAVFYSKAAAYVYVPDGTGYSQKAVTVGRTSELFTEIVEGLAESDHVLLREPQAHEIVSRLPVVERENQSDVKEQPDEQMAPASQPAGPAAPMAVPS